MILHFPQLVPALWAGPRIPGAFFLDPGLAPQTGEGLYRPASLPCDPRRARRLLNDFLGFGEMFARPGDISQMRAPSGAAPCGETTAAIQAELDARMGLGGPARAPAVPDQASAEAGWRQRAQLTLLLELTREEGIAESRELGARLTSSLSRFDAVLGGEVGERQASGDEDMDPEALRLGRVAANFAVPLDQEEAMPWRRVLGALLCFLPAGAVLVTTEAQAAEALAETGAVFVPVGEIAGLPADLPEGCRAAEVTAAQLAQAAFETGAAVPGVDPAARFFLVLAV